MWSCSETETFQSSCWFSMPRKEDTSNFLVRHTVTLPSSKTHDLMASPHQRGPHTHVHTQLFFLSSTFALFFTWRAFERKNKGHTTLCALHSKYHKSIWRRLSTNYLSNPYLMAVMFKQDGGRIHCLNINMCCSLLVALQSLSEPGPVIASLS